MDKKELTSKIGEEILGPYLVSYCQWLYKQKEKLHLDMLIFTSRDGFLLQKIYNILFPNEITQYIKLSRKALRLPYLYKCSTYGEYLDVLPPFRKISIGDLANSLIVFPEESAKIFDKFDINYTVERKNLKKDKILSEAYDFIRNQNIEEGIVQEKLLIQYLRSCGIGQGMKVGFVDYSFKGTSQYMLEKILKGSLSVEIVGLYFGCNKLAKKRLQDRTFSFLENKISEIDLIFIEKALIIERLMLEPVGSTIGYKLSKENKAIPIMEEYKEYRNDDVITEIQKAVLKYTYKEKGLNIDPRVASRKVLELIKHPTKEIVGLLGKLEDDNIQKQNILFVETRNCLEYIRQPGLFFKDLKNGLWHQAFLRQFFFGKIWAEVYNWIFAIVYFFKNTV